MQFLFRLLQAAFSTLKGNLCFSWLSLWIWNHKKSSAELNCWLFLVGAMKRYSIALALFFCFKCNKRWPALIKDALYKVLHCSSDAHLQRNKEQFPVHYERSLQVSANRQHHKLRIRHHFLLGYVCCNLQLSCMMWDWII